MSTGNKMDDEFLALRHIEKILSKLDARARARVIQYVSDRVDDAFSATPEPKQSNAKQQDLDGVFS